MKWWMATSNNSISTRTPPSSAAAAAERDSSSNRSSSSAANSHMFWDAYIWAARVTRLIQFTQLGQLNFRSHLYGFVHLYGQPLSSKEPQMRQRQSSAVDALTHIYNTHTHTYINAQLAFGVLSVRVGGWVGDGSRRIVADSLSGIFLYDT